MASKNITLDTKNLVPMLQSAGHALSRYVGIMFFVLVAGVYGFVLMRINSLSNAQPDESAVSSQVSPGGIPKVDPKVAEQLNSLKDNSSSVKTLFEDARQNPFQE